MLVGAGRVGGLGRCFRLNILAANFSPANNVRQVEHSVLDVRYALIRLLMLKETLLLRVRCCNHLLLQGGSQGLSRGHREQAVIIGLRRGWIQRRRLGLLDVGLDSTDLLQHPALAVVVICVVLNLGRVVPEGLL